MQTGSVLGDVKIKSYFDMSGPPDTFLSFPVMGNMSNDILPYLTGYTYRSMSQFHHSEPTLGVIVNNIRFVCHRELSPL